MKTLSKIMGRLVFVAALLIQPALVVGDSQPAVSITDKRAFNVGDEFRVKGTSSVNKDIVVSSYGKLLDNKTIELSAEAEADIRVDQVDERGAVTKARFRILSCKIKSMEGAFTPIEPGSVLTVTLKELATPVIKLNGEVVEESALAWLNMFVSALENDHGDILCVSHPVSPGDEWAVDAARIADEQNNTEDGVKVDAQQVKGQARFVGVRDYPGTPLYEISSNISLGEVEFPEIKELKDLQAKTNTLQVDTRLYLPADNTSTIVGRKETVKNFHRLVDPEAPDRLVIQQSLRVTEQFQRYAKNTQLSGATE